jgi:hypothetical protein
MPLIEDEFAMAQFGQPDFGGMSQRELVHTFLTWMLELEIKRR